MVNLVITLGDPSSINIYAVCRILQDFSPPPKAKLILIGNRKIFEEQIQSFGFSPLDFSCKFDFIDINPGDHPKYIRGNISAQAIYHSQKIPNPKIIISCPINKKLVEEVGFPFPGHTEYYAHQEKVETLMLMTSFSPKKFFVAPCTNHIPLSKVSSSLSIPLIVQKAKLLHQALCELGNFPHPQIGLCGLNPHCSDDGKFGWEEKEILEPAVGILQKENIPITGPISADTVFYHAYQGKYDGILAMYHDQALIPIKTISFSTCVNISYGLPYLRMSPDHGPGEDLFRQKSFEKVELGSFQTCFQLAYEKINSLPL